MLKPVLDYPTILRALTSHDVDFIVVGGVAGVLHGAPLHTGDLDIVHSRTPANLERLTAALASLGAHYRFHTKTIVPTPDHLVSTGHHLLTTNVGYLDVLGTLADNQGYDDLVAHCSLVTLELGLSIRVLDLEKLIDIKERTGRPKDQLAVLILRETLKEKQRLEGTGESSTPE